MKKLETLEMMPTRIRIASILRKAILSGEFQEGEELSLTAIANNLGVSRTPVREAFQTLASENLLQLRMNKGAIVKGITVKTIQEHFKMRILLEGEAAARAAMRGFDATHLLEQHRRMLELDGNFSTEQYQSYNQELHTSLCSLLLMERQLLWKDGKGKGPPAYLPGGARQDSGIHPNAQPLSGPQGDGASY